MQQIKILLTTFFLLLHLLNYAQTIDSTKKITTFSGSIGANNNGFSIVPAFSFDSPTAMLFFSWRKEKISFDTDIRLIPSAKKGSMFFWFRYYPVQRKKFTFRMGCHPAFNFQTRDIPDAKFGTLNITQMRRFFAWELAPMYKITPKFGVGLYYLQGNGLQKDGPQTSHYVSLVTSISNLKLGNKLKLSLTPSFFYLNLDGYEGNYFTSNTTLAHTKLPFTITSTINKTITSNLPGNKDFQWNIGLNYVFRKKIAQLK